MKLKHLLFYLSAFALLAIFGCSQFADSTKCTTSKVMTAAELRTHFPSHYIMTADASYTEVNPEFADKWHSYTGKVMDLLGMAANWSQQFDCNRFAMMKLAVIHVRFLVDTWHARNPGQAPAAGEVWYVPDAQPPGLPAGQKAGHAIIVTIEGGAKVYRDIYSPRKLTLSPAEEQSIWLIKF